MKTSSRAGAWAAAVREHDVVLHVAMAYEIGIAACDGSAGKRLVSPPVVAWLSRHLLLPLMRRSA